MDDKKVFKKAKTLFNNLKTDPDSAIFPEGFLDNRLLKRLKKSKYDVDRQWFRLVNLADTKNFLDDSKSPTWTDYVEKREIDRSTLYSFDFPFQFVHPDVGNFEFLGKNATFPQYVLVIVDSYTSKVYTYSMKSRKQIFQKMKLFHGKVKNKRKGKHMRLQVENEFQQDKIKDLNDLDNVDMFTISFRGGKLFVAVQKIRELKTRIAKLNVRKLKISPAKIIERPTLNMNLMKSRKYGLSPEEIQRRSLARAHFKTIFNMHRLEKTQRFHRRLDDYDIRKYYTKRKS